MSVPEPGSASGPAWTPSEADLHVMTLNVRRILPTLRRDSPDAWSIRRPLLRRLVSENRPHVLAVQEALPDHLAVLTEALGNGYVRVGTGRAADGSDEHCAVFVDSSRAVVDSWHQLALSRTPHRPGSRAWGAPFPRIATVAQLTDRVSGGPLQVVSTHLDPFSAYSRRRSAALLHGVVASAGMPSLLMGDANSAIGSQAYSTLTADGVLLDGWNAADRRLTPEWRTFSHYRPPRTGKRIDWLLVSPEVGVRAIAIDAVRYDGRAPSDHEPVRAFLSLPSSGTGTLPA